MSQRRPKDRSHWGDEAFRAMHNKPITREVLHKALQEPTARELLDTIDSNAAKYVLASRVEAVLALHYVWPSEGPDKACAHCMNVYGHRIKWPCPTVRILDGEKP